MLHFQVLQNQRLTPHFLPQFLSGAEPGKTAPFVLIILKYIAKLFFFLPFLLTSWQLQAADSPSLYMVDTLVTGQAIDVRERAFQRGLDEVFVRISGDSGVMEKLQRPVSRSYVQRFSYEPLKKEMMNAEGESLKQRIKIQYNGNLIEKYLRDNALPVWGYRRADVVIWLAVRDGKNEYVLKNSDRSLIKTSLIDALTRRGIPDLWPSYDSEDKNIISAVDIRGGFKSPLLAASKRYSRGPVLSGSLSWNGKIWQSSWELIMENGDKHWSFNHKSYSHLINEAVDHAADAMGAVFATREESASQQMSVLHVNIEAINSMEKYSRVERYLKSLSAVEAVNPLHTNGGGAMFEVVLKSSEAAFLSLIKNDGELLEVNVSGASIQKMDIQEINAQEAGAHKIDAPVTAADVQTNSVLLNVDARPKALAIMPSTPPSSVKVKNTPVFHYRFAH